MRWILACLIALLPVVVHSQDRRPSHCIALADATPGMTYLWQARFGEPLADDTVRLNYVNHATFLLETADGITVATDYTGFLGVVNHVPDVVTMNHAHSSHWTPSPDGRIPHVLEGWQQEHHLDLGEMLIRNVQTDIRSRFGDGTVEVNGNSIFVFEVAGLCIGHLGHLHHEPDPGQYAALGRLDVVMAPVDGGLTLDRPTLIRMLKKLRSSVVIPMHWFGQGTLEAFLTDMADEFVIEREVRASVELSLRTLPRQPTVLVLQPRFIESLDDF